jgi:hypothetical protein
VTVRSGSARIAAVLLMMVVLGACKDSNDAVPPVDPGPAMHQQAVDALSRWDTAVSAFTEPVIVPVGEPYGLIGGSDSAAAKYQKSAYNGLFSIAQDLPTNPAATGTVTWADGQTAQLPALSADDAWTAAPKAMPGSCADCATLQITDAKLVTGTVQTTRGPVTMPLWAYHLAGDTVWLTVPAVTLPQPDPTPPEWDSAHPPAGMSIDVARGSVTGRTLTVIFVGAKGGADQPCGVDYTGEAVESAAAVVVVLHEKHHPGNEICNAMGFVRQTDVTLKSPLGERAVLENRQGLPVPTVRLP